MFNIELYKKIGDKIQCSLCPHFCLLKDGEIGKCRARKNNKGKIELISYGMVSSMAVDPIKNKPFKKFLVGSSTLTFALIGKCNLHCQFCENHKISQDNKIEGKYFSISNLIKMAREKNCKSISMSYNEPTLFYEFLINLGERCKQEEIPFLLKTNAYVNKEPWKEICKVVDAMNIDLKAGTTESFKAITGCSQYVTKDRIKEAYEAGVHIEISIPLYYSDDELEEEINNIGIFLSSIDREIPCHLLIISPSYLYDDFIFNHENLSKAKNILSSYMNNIYEVI